MSYFHTGTRTIIGAEAFHCPVRDGKEWDHLAMVIRLNLLPYWTLAISQFGQHDQFTEYRIRLLIAVFGVCQETFQQEVYGKTLKFRLRQNYRVKPHGQLVLVSLTHYCASTPSLSTSWS